MGLQPTCSPVCTHGVGGAQTLQLVAEVLRLGLDLPELGREVDAHIAQVLHEVPAPLLGSTGSNGRQGPERGAAREGKRQAQSRRHPREAPPHPKQGIADQTETVVLACPGAREANHRRPTDLRAVGVLLGPFKEKLIVLIHLPLSADKVRREGDRTAYSSFGSMKARGCVG